MIETVINTIIYIRQILYYGLVLSYGIGKGIILGFDYVLSLFQDIFSSARDLFTVLSEDFIFFLNDILQKTSFIALGGTTALQSSFNSLLYLVEMAKSSVTFIFTAFYSVFTSAWSGVFKIFTYIGVTIAFLKNLIILCGLGIWFSIKLVPLIVMYIITLPLSLTGVIIQEIVEIVKSGTSASILAIKNVFDFIIDMPMEAVAGLIAGACIVYVLLKFNIILYQTARQKCQGIVSGFFYILNCIRKVGKVEAKQTVEIPTKTEDNYSSLDGYCVVCQEREKCVLLLPCKHLCLCEECCKTVQRYNRRCPVCRSYLQKTMKIYL